VSPLKGTRKGAEFEQVVAEYLGTERRVKHGNLDRGDLVFQQITIECKAPGRGKPLNLSAAMTEAKTEGKNAGTPDRYAVITRRTGYPVSEAFFTIPLWLAKELGLLT
jgi:hypothetical protein